MTITAPVDGDPIDPVWAGLITDAVNSLVTSVGNITGAWTSYTPTWTSAGTAPAIGNGTLTGRYRLVGKTVDVVMSLVAGSTTTFGTSEWYLSLPSGLDAAVQNLVVGPAFFNDAGTAYYSGTCAARAAATKLNFIQNASQVASNIPHVWANTDILIARATYYIA